MSTTFEEVVTMSKFECCKCGVSFAIPQKLEQERRKDHESFYCPNGHGQHFQQETEAEKYKRLLEREQRAAASLREAQVAAERAHKRSQAEIRKLKKRSAAGVCPCCNRTFSQLAQHMASKHKEFRELAGITQPKALPPAEGVLS